MSQRLVGSDTSDPDLGACANRKAALKEQQLFELVWADWAIFGNRSVENGRQSETIKQL